MLFRSGRYIVFTTNFDGDDEIFVYDQQSRAVTKITDNTFTDRDPHYSFDGRSIVYSSDQGESGLLDLYVMRLSDNPRNPFDGLTIERLTETRSNDYAPQWSPDDRFIAYANDGNGTGDIFVYDVERGVSRQLTRDAGAEDRYPTWTPDARAVAFISNRDGRRFQIYTLSIDGRDLTRIVDTTTDVQSLDYRPDLRFRVDLLN